MNEQPLFSMDPNSDNHVIVNMQGTRAYILAVYPDDRIRVLDFLNTLRPPLVEGEMSTLETLEPLLRLDVPSDEKIWLDAAERAHKAYMSQTVITGEEINHPAFEWFARDAAGTADAFMARVYQHRAEMKDPDSVQPAKGEHESDHTTRTLGDLDRHGPQDH